jgi:hypothetical protein
MEPGVPVGPSAAAGGVPGLPGTTGAAAQDSFNYPSNSQPTSYNFAADEW